MKLRERSTEADIQCTTKLPTKEDLFQVLEIITDEEMIEMNASSDNGVAPDGTNVNDRSPFFLVEEGVKWGEDID